MNTFIDNLNLFMRKEMNDKKLFTKRAVIFFINYCLMNSEQNESKDGLS